MAYSIRKAKWEDMPRILGIYAYARQFMAENGNPNQWGKHHPAVSTLEEDVQNGNLYVVEDPAGVHGVFAFLLGEDPTYHTIYDGAWRSHTPYGTIHRIASDGSGGILAAALSFARNVIGHIRMDTHGDNHIMQTALAKAGFSRRGIIYIADGTPRIAYDMI